MSATTGDVLRAAADEVAKGWCRLNNEDDKGACCAYGGILRVFRSGQATEDEALRAYYALDIYLGSNVCVWNDQRGRTQAQVVTAMRECALVSDASLR